MAESLDRSLARWVDASLIDAQAAERIRVFEAGQTAQTGWRWPVVIALTFGALLLAAGVLLFVSAHWDQMSASQRMLLVLLLVAIFHASAAVLQTRLESLSVALHAVGTLALGAGLALTGQIFHLDTKWSTGAMLWAAGAAVGWGLLRQWPQAALLAILAPYWLIVEGHERWHSTDPALAAGCAMLAFTYLSARTGPYDSAVRRALAWIGGLGLIPAIAVTCLSARAPFGPYDGLTYAIGVAIALGLAILMRRRDALYNAVAIGWVLLLPLTAHKGESPALYASLAVGALGLTVWGIAERRPERINLGVAGFAITLLTFYFSSVMDKLGRSASLIGLGVLFLAGGYALERLRRRLMARIEERSL